MNKRRHNPLSFLAIVLLTTVVWFAVAMSEKKEFPLQVRIVMSGFDERQYAVVHADSLLTLRVESTGFNALLFNLRREPFLLAVNLAGENVRHNASWSPGGERLQHHTVAVSDLGDELKEMLASSGMRLTGRSKDTLSFVFATRASRRFRPDIGTVEIDFAEGYALYGEPQVSPSEVTLYGPQELLASIDRVSAKSTQLHNVSRSATYQIALDTSFCRLGDIHSSADHLSVTIPVERFVECEYTVPIHVAGTDSSSQIRLFPPEVTLKLWVAQRDLSSLSSERFSVTVDYADILAGHTELPLRLASFPQSVRLRQLAPSSAKYVIIK